jgi:hypothetical protein
VEIMLKQRDKAGRRFEEKSSRFSRRHRPGTLTAKRRNRAMQKCILPFEHHLLLFEASNNSAASRHGVANDAR